jgi:TonB family protein
VAPEVSSRPVVLVNDPVMARTTPFASAPPVTPSSRARVADQRSPAKKPTARRGEATGISIPSVPSALMAGFDSVLQARSASGSAVGESFPVPLPPVSGNAPRVTFEGDDQVNVSQRARLIGAQPTPRYPYELIDVQGEVRVRFDVDTSGRPVMSSLLVVNSSNTLMTAAVLKVIPGLRFEPARSGGPDSKAIEDVVQMGFQFRPAK